MKLYVCWFTAPKVGPRDHPCGVAYHALIDAGHDPEVVYAHGWGLLPDFLNRTAGRREVRELSGGSDWVPALVLESGDFIQGSKEIVAWAEANPAGAAVAAAGA